MTAPTITREGDLDLEAFLRRPLFAHLATASPAGPRESPVWFLYEEGEFLIYSLPGTARTANIEANPRVSLNLDGNGEGGDILENVDEILAEYDAVDGEGDVAVTEESEEDDDDTPCDDDDEDEESLDYEIEDLEDLEELMEDPIDNAIEAEVNSSGKCFNRSVLLIVKCKM